jgi:16S rRNA (guanine527-N7)-methyltransferase
VIPVISKYFPELGKEQLDRISAFSGNLLSWNEKINLVSRKDSDEIVVRHILHSLVISKFITFETGSYILDAGTGGGLPGIPLAILFPASRFLLADSIGKKIKAVNDMIEKTGLSNVTARQVRVEDLNEKFDFVVSRAVTSMAELFKWTKSKIKTGGPGGGRNGIICLKGGNLEKEIGELKKPVSIVPVSRYYDEEFFNEKKIVFIPVP